QEMVQATIKAFLKRIDALSWMSPKTKSAAKDKVASLRVGVGYPDTWREYARSLGKIGKAVDRDEWWMLPQTFDALNMPLQNSMNFPAALLQPPLFDL